MIFIGGRFFIIYCGRSVVEVVKDAKLENQLSSKVAPMREKQYSHQFLGFYAILFLS